MGSPDAYLARTITPQQIELAQAERTVSSTAINSKSSKNLSEAVDAYMRVRALKCNAEQAR
jgi:hypothetical protein